jgi:hypothetical protein
MRKLLATEKEVQHCQQVTVMISSNTDGFACGHNESLLMMCLMHQYNPAVCAVDALFCCCRRQ